MRYLWLDLLGLGFLLVFGLMAVGHFRADNVADGGAALIFAIGGSLFLWAGLLAAFLDWREGRGEGPCCRSGWNGGGSG